jgi:pyrimidine-nucleoside phosphorylase
MTLRDLIERKRDGGHIDAADWHEFARDLAAGSLPDYQVSALLMAIFFRGLSDDETVALTEAMLQSGRIMERSSGSTERSPGSTRRVDKHSVGGVGDKVSIVLAPLVAACGVAVPMVSGRGLGHTGGTLDKLESIPGFQTRLSLATAAAQLDRIGCVIMGQTGEIAPADRTLYSMRDATATVESIPLIASSIMSKKLAEGLDGLVLDVKTGAGAFLTTFDDDIKLTKMMIALGARHNCPVVALLTDMDSPLGVACGNANEIVESVQSLKGGGPPDLRELVLRFGAEMLVVGGVSSDPAAAREKLEHAISSGRALEKFREIVAAQGGDVAVCEDPALVVQAAPVREDYLARRDGVVQRVEPRAVGKGITAMGGGRTKMADVVDSRVGFQILAKPGDRVTRGQPLATILARDAATAAAGRDALDAAFLLGDGDVTRRQLVSHRVTSAGVETL